MLSKISIHGSTIIVSFLQEGCLRKKEESQYDRKPNFTSTSTCNLNVKIVLVTETLGIFFNVLMIKKFVETGSQF